MQVAVRNEDHGIVVIDFLNDCRNRIIQLAGDHVPPLAGEDFQTALGVDSGQHWILHAVQLDGFFQLVKLGFAGVLFVGAFKLVFEFINIGAACAAGKLVF